MPLARPVAFPLHPIVEGKCGCGYADCKRIGKHPAVLWGEIKYGDEVPRPVEGAGVGLKTGAFPYGSGIIVVDVDGDEAHARLIELERNYGEPLPETTTIATGRGLQFWFDHPGFHVKNSAGDLAKGVDIRGDGGFVVAPGSPHKNGKTYRVIVDVPPAKAPAWLLDWLRRQKPAGDVQGYAGDVSGPERERRRQIYAKYLREDAPARGPDRRGQGDKILFDVVQRGAYDLALPVEDVLELVRDHYDPRCSPMWGDELEERVLHKARCAKEESTRPACPPLPEDLEHLASATAPDLPTFTAPAASAQPDDAPRVSPLGEIWGGWNRPIEPPVYLLEGLIPEGKVCTFYAEGGSVKSWAAFALAIAVASGGQWLGRGVKQGRALILDYEDGRYEFQRRMRILRGGTFEDLPDLGYLYCGPSLDKHDLWRELVALGLRLLVIDTLGAGMPPSIDENDSRFSEAVKLAGRFTECGCTVLIVAHANKTGGLRGTSAIRDQSDVVFKFEAVSETDDVKRMRMVCDKPGPQKKPPPVNLELSDAGLDTFEDEANRVGRNASGSRDVKAAVLLALEKGPMVPKAIEQDIGARTKAVADAICELHQEGKIVKLGYHAGWELDDPKKRRARILEKAETCQGTKADLARVAFVATADVQELIDAKELFLRTGKDGGGFVCRRSSDLCPGATT